MSSFLLLLLTRNIPYPPLIWSKYSPSLDKDSNLYVILSINITSLKIDHLLIESKELQYISTILAGNIIKLFINNY